MSKTSKRSLIFGVGALTCVFLCFQNCGFKVMDQVGADSQNATGYRDADLGEPASGELSWKNYLDNTAAPSTPFSSTLSVSPFDSSTSIIYNGDYFVYDAKTQTVHKLVTMDGSTRLGEIPFPSLGRLVILVRDSATQVQKLMVYDLRSSQKLFESGPLSNQSNPCRYNQQDEPDGKILCSIMAPTQTNLSEIQATRFDVKNLTFTNLAQVPSQYSLTTGWGTGGPTSQPRDSFFIFPKEDKAIVSVYDSVSKLNVALLLTPNSSTIFGPTAIADFRGTSSQRTWAQFQLSGEQGDRIGNSGCDQRDSLYTGASAYAFALKPDLYGAMICLPNQDWMVNSSRLLKCSAPNNCTEISFTFENTNFPFSSSRIVYLDYDKSLLVTSPLSSYSGVALLRLDMLSGQSTAIDLGPSVGSDSYGLVSGTPQVFTNSTVRKYQGTLVLPQKVYIPELRKVFDMPIIPGSATQQPFWSTRRTINGSSYFAGLNTTDSRRQTYVANLRGEYFIFTDSIILERENQASAITSPLIFMQSPNRDIVSYNIETRTRVIVGQVPAGYSALSCAHIGDYLGIVYASTTAGSVRRFQVIKNAQVLFDRTTTDGDVSPLRDGTGFLFAMPGIIPLPKIIKFDVRTEKISADKNCNPSYNSQCYLVSFMTSQGEFLVSPMGLIYDSDLNLVREITGQTLTQDNYVNPETLFTSAYFVKSSVRDPATGVVTTAYSRYDFASNILVDIGSSSGPGFIPFDNNYLSLNRIDPSNLTLDVTDGTHVFASVDRLLTFYTGFDHVIFATGTLADPKYTYLSKKDLSTIRPLVPPTPTSRLGRHLKSLVVFSTRPYPNAKFYLQPLAP